MWHQIDAVNGVDGACILSQHQKEGGCGGLKAPWSPEHGLVSPTSTRTIQYVHVTIIYHVKYVYEQYIPQDLRKLPWLHSPRLVCLKPRGIIHVVVRRPVTCLWTSCNLGSLVLAVATRWPPLPIILLGVDNKSMRRQVNWHSQQKRTRHHHTIRGRHFYPYICTKMKTTV